MIKLSDAKLRLPLFNMVTGALTFYYTDTRHSIYRWEATLVRLSQRWTVVAESFNDLREFKEIRSFKVPLLKLIYLKPMTSKSHFLVFVWGNSFNNFRSTYFYNLFNVRNKKNVSRSSLTLFPNSQCHGCLN